MGRVRTGLAAAAFAVAVAALLAGAGTWVPLVILLAAVYTLARHGPKGLLWLAIAVLVGVFGFGFAAGELARPDLATLVVLFASAVLLGLYRAEVAVRAAREARLAVAAERARLAREVHDIVAHNVSVMVALSDGAAMTAASDPQRAGEAMVKVSSTGRGALEQLRRSLDALQTGHDAGFDELLDGFRAAGLRVSLEADPDSLTGPQRQAVYRVVREALTNALKHAGPGARTRVAFAVTPSGLEVEVTDDGGGHGLSGMRQRVSAFGGRVDAGPGASGGWQVKACLDLQGRA